MWLHFPSLFVILLFSFSLPLLFVSVAFVILLALRFRVIYCSLSPDCTAVTPHSLSGLFFYNTIMATSAVMIRFLSLLS